MSFTIYYTLAVVGVGIAALIVFDAVQFHRKGWTLSRAWAKLGREHPIVVFLVTSVVMLSMGLAAGHFWWGDIQGTDVSEWRCDILIVDRELYPAPPIARFRPARGGDVLDVLDISGPAAERWVVGQRIKVVVED